MTKRDSFLLRLDPAILDALKTWAEAELRSTNAHLDYLLRDALRRSGRMPEKKGERESESNDSC
jgi:hypothetical protein